MTARLTGRVAVVAGAASGIGAAIARRFRAEGAEVIAADLPRDELRALAAAIGALAVPCDVTDAGAVRALIGTALERHGRLEIVVNAAGITAADDVADIDDECWQRLMDVNLRGTMHVCRAALPALRACGAGAIVNVASVAAFNASPGMASYAASKAGVVALTRSIANAYGLEGVRANCLCPGWVRTPMSEAEVRALAAERGVTTGTVWEELRARIALERIGTPEEMAGCALFLASSDSAFVTGAVLVADGGARLPAAARAI
jgi:3-oxoacyl-[acyl-carrier protein] reductase